MGLITKSVFFILIALSLFSCGYKPDNQMDFPQEIAAAYFQNSSGEDGQALAGTDFYIELVKPLERGIVLEKVYFQNQQARIEKKKERIFVAHFYPINANQDFILDSNPLKEYGNKAPVLKPKFDLKPTEAVLEYKIKTKTYYYKMTAVKEKPIIVNPSTNKPKN